MPVFSYTVKTENGEVIQKSVEAENRQEALSRIRDRAAGVVVRIEERSSPYAAIGLPRAPARPERPAAVSGAAGIRKGAGFGAGRIRQGDLATLFRQLSISVNAGVPLRDSIESIVEDLEHQAFRRVLARVVDRLHDGQLFSQALASEGQVFPRLCVALIATAEEAGSMGQTLEQLAVSMEKSEALSRKIRSITAYPLFVGVFFSIVVSVMTLFVLPKFQESFTGWGAELPPLTRIVFGVNAVIVRHAVLIGLILGAGIAGFVAYGRTASGRLRIDRMKLGLPLFGVCFRKVAVARFCKNLAIMIRGGVPIASAIEITAAVTGNRVIENALRSVREKIVMGSDITHSLASERVFPGLLVRMVGVGESSGRLPDVLEKIADGYEVEVEGAIMVATSLFEPIVIVFFGMVVLTLVMAIYLPVFTMASHMK